MVAAKENVQSTKLRAIKQHFVVEEQTRMVLYEAARSSSCTRSDANGYREYTKYDNGFRIRRRERSDMNQALY